MQTPANKFRRWRRTLLATTLLPVFTLLPMSARAGWSSGGGELLRDARNPWFLKNVTDVNYCIEIDDANFGQTRDRIRLIIQKALENWKAEFTHALNRGLELGIATQNFHEIPCQANVDLTFQFGVLHSEQYRRLGDPTRFAGISVRTDYDRAKMRGKGFIYVSPARGQLKLSGEDIIAEPWALENGALLYFILLHELGHVFGLPHTNEFGNIMSELMVEMALQSRSAPGYAKYMAKFPKPRIFNFDSEHEGYAIMMCHSGSSVPEGRLGFISQSPRSLTSEFFGIPKDFECQGQTIQKNILSVYGMKKQGDSKSVSIGSAKLESFKGILDTEPVQTVWLPKEQTLFPEQKEGPVFGPQRQAITRLKGLYRSDDGKISREIFMNVTPSGNGAIGGVMDGKLIVDISSGF